MAGDAIVTWGKPLTGFWTYREDVPKEREARHGDSIEAVNEIVQKRPLTVPEMEMVVSDFVEKMKEKHPEHDVRYVAIEKGSPLKMRVHLVEHSPVPVGTILEIIAVVVAGIIATKFATEVWSIIDKTGREIKQFLSNPIGYATANPGRTALMVGAPIAGALVVDKIFFEE